MSTGPTWQQASDVLVTDVDDELVLLDPRTQRMFTLNSTGAVVWRTVAAGLPAVIERLVAVFAVDEAKARADAEQLIAELVAAGLLIST